jgi:hypothetical protein
MDKDLLKVTIVEKCRECSEPVENVIDYYAGEFTDSLNALGLNNLCDSCAASYEADPTSWSEPLFPSCYSKH